jgi:hypothetical protein
MANSHLRDHKAIQQSKSCTGLNALNDQDLCAGGEICKQSKYFMFLKLLE